MQPKSNEIKSTRWRAGVVGLMALLAAGLVAVPASAHHPLTNAPGSVPPAPNPATGCGEVIDSTTAVDPTTNTMKLTHHVGPCVSDGLLVYRSGTLNTATPPACVDYFTIDLDGWDIFGTPASDGGSGIWIENQVCVKITNSKYTGAVTNSGGSPTSEIYEFDSGVAIKGGSHNVVEKVSVHSSGDGQSPAKYGDGIAIDSSSNNTVTNNFVGTDGITAMLCLAGAVTPGAHVKDCGAIPHVGYDAANPGAQDTHSKLTSLWGANGAFSGVGIYGFSGFAAANNHVHRNVIRNNYRCFTLGNGSCQSDGVRLEGAQVTANVIEKNEISGSALDGVGFLVGPDSNEIKDNIIERNGKHHRTHRQGDGIRLLPAGASSNTISGNRVCRNAAHGIRIDRGRTNPLPTDTNHSNGGNAVTNNAVGDGTTTNPINGGVNPVACDDNAWVTAAAFDLSDDNIATTTPANAECDGDRTATVSLNTWSGNYVAGSNTRDKSSTATCIG